tara:strand:- start:3101 stop:4045 length:945 start_codon:yes stop_codon:yes gene_type:complete
MYKFQRHADDLMDFYQKRYKVKQLPQVIFKDDHKNSQNILGKTGQYDPDNKVVTIFVTGRHGKDVLRSLAHELIHHLQNERGDLKNIGSTEVGYAQKDDHMRNMEREAYEQGNLCLRDWEDQIKTNNIQLYETIYKADRTKGDSVMSLKEQRNVNFHNKLMEAWGFSKKNEESVLLKEGSVWGPSKPDQKCTADQEGKTTQTHGGPGSQGGCQSWVCKEGKWHKAAEENEDCTHPGGGVDESTLKEAALDPMNVIDGWRGGEKSNLDEDEEVNEEDAKVLSTNHPNDPGNRTVNNEKVEETVRKAIQNILKEIV